MDTPNLSPPPGFTGLNPNIPVSMYFRHLPHWRQPGATYFVTFRLADSLPQEKLEVLRMFRADWLRKNPTPKADALSKFSLENMRRIEAWLDKGMGSCHLKEEIVSRELIETMHHFDDVRYQLSCYVVMPNHVHVIVRPSFSDSADLEVILRGWKGYSARGINRLLRRNGSLWQDESFDRIVRNEEHLYRAVQYIGANPLRAGLPKENWVRWIRPDWVLNGWSFSDEAK